MSFLLLLTSFIYVDTSSSSRSLYILLRVSLTSSIIPPQLTGLSVANPSRDTGEDSPAPLSCFYSRLSNLCYWGLLAQYPGESLPFHLCPSVSPELEHRRERWEQRRQKRRQQRSISKEKWVETLVVADAKMVEYHGQPQVESYVLTIMNMVRLLQLLQGTGGGKGGTLKWDAEVDMGRNADRLASR